MAEMEAVRVRACSCPETPHDEGDVVYLLPSLSLEGGAAAEMDLVLSGEQANSVTWLLARWTVTFVRYGAVGWNWLRLDEKGRSEPVPFDVEVLTADYKLARLVAAKANELYQEVLLGPLLEAAGVDAPAAKANRAQRRQSQRGRTAASTSPRPVSITRSSESSSQAASAGPLSRTAR